MEDRGGQVLTPESVTLYTDLLRSPPGGRLQSFRAVRNGQKQGT